MHLAWVHCGCVHLHLFNCSGLRVQSFPMCSLWNSHLAGIDKMTEKSPASVAHIEQAGGMILATQSETASVQPGQQSPASDPIPGPQQVSVHEAC